jgi:hypothetical protein
LGLADVGRFAARSNGDHSTPKRLFPHGCAGDFRCFNWVGLSNGIQLTFLHAHCSGEWLRDSEHSQKSLVG